MMIEFVFVFVVFDDVLNSLIFVDYFYEDDL